MKNIFKFLIISLFSTVTLLSCVTGNDDSAVLREHEEQIAKTPRVTNLTVDGVAPSRDEQSNWIPFIVNPGQTVIITATFESGNGAASSTFDFSRKPKNT